jgi:lipoprotein signal peptidase
VVWTQRDGEVRQSDHVSRLQLNSAIRLGTSPARPDRVTRITSPKENGQPAAVARLHRSTSHPAITFAACALAVATVDLVSKRLAVAFLAERDVPVMGNVIRLAVVLNDQSAFGIALGPYTWHINFALTLIALVLTVVLCQALSRIDVWAPIVLGLIAGAAAGNLLSLLLSPRGVIDFVAVSRGDGRELVFNLADVAAVLGLLLIVRTGVRVVHAIRAGDSGVILRR